MNKAPIIIIVTVIVGLGIVSFLLMNSSENQQNPALQENLVLDEPVSLEDQSAVEESTKTGNNISVELTESVGLKSP